MEQQERIWGRLRESWVAEERAGGDYWRGKEESREKWQYKRLVSYLRSGHVVLTGFNFQISGVGDTHFFARLDVHASHTSTSQHLLKKMFELQLHQISK